MLNSINKEEAEELREELRNLCLASEVADCQMDVHDVAMDATPDAQMIGDGDDDDDSYHDSDQSYSDDEIEEDDEVVDQATLQQDALVESLIKENNHYLVDAAHQGFEVDDPELVASTAVTFNKLALVIGDGLPVTGHAVIGQLAVHVRELLDEKRDFAWFGKSDLIDAYLTIGKYATSSEEILAAIAEFDRVVDDGKVVILKLASALKLRAMD